MLSIIVPAYNEQEHIEKAVNSICQQTLADLDIILVDDGSTDLTGSIMDKLAKMDSRIKVIHKPNGGLVSARKSGVQAAAGEYVTFVDGDDWIEEGAYEEMLAFGEGLDIIIAGHMEDTGDICKEFINKIPAGVYQGESLIREFYPGIFLAQSEYFEWRIFSSLCNKIFKKSIIDQVIGGVNDEVTMGEDAATVAPAFLLAKKVGVMDKCYYHYIKSPNSMIGEIPPIEVERKRFALLHQCVNQQLAKYTDKYDAGEDWIRFMLFMMIPRADQLYQGYQELDYLYPFKGVRKGSRIVIYAAGTYGQRLYKYLKKTGFCNVVLWVDRNYLELQKMGLPVEAPDKIKDAVYDYVILPMSFEKSRKAVEEYLKSFCSEDKIVSMDTDLILAKESLAAFGLLI